MCASHLASSGVESPGFSNQTSWLVFQLTAFNFALCVSGCVKSSQGGIFEIFVSNGEIFNKKDSKQS